MTLPDTARAAGTYECLPPGYGLAFSPLGTAGGVGTPDACEPLCSANPACELFAHDVASQTCALGRDAFSGASGSNAVAAVPPSTRFCLRTLNLRQPFGAVPAAPPAPLPLSASPPSPSPRPPSLLVDLGFSPPAPPPVIEVSWVREGQPTTDATPGCALLIARWLADRWPAGRGPGY